jgi:hypothetical protein
MDGDDAACASTRENSQSIRSRYLNLWFQSSYQPFAFQSSIALASAKNPAALMASSSSAHVSALYRSKLPFRPNGHTPDKNHSMP